MKKIGLLSDTHSYIDNNLTDFFGNCDEIWHAGDIGSEQVLDFLEKITTVRAVYGNIDSSAIRLRCCSNLRFTIENTKVWITHIGGYPGRYDRRVKPEIYNNPPDLFISGHSHILKIIYDKQLNFLHLNPGAYGKYGFHKVRTALRFKIEQSRIFDMEIYEAAI